MKEPQRREVAANETTPGNALSLLSLLGNGFTGTKEPQRRKAANETTPDNALSLLSLLDNGYTSTKEP
ncbi:unnamed protein product, partial [Iphiclides podalirius]